MIVITIKKKTSIDIFIVITVDLLKNICYNDIKGYCFARKPYKNLGESKKWESQTNLIFKAIWEPKEASEHWGISQTTVNKWCRGNKIPGAEQDRKGSPWRIPYYAIKS